MIEIFSGKKKKKLLFNYRIKTDFFFKFIVEFGFSVKQHHRFQALSEKGLIINKSCEDEEKNKP